MPSKGPPVLDYHFLYYVRRPLAPSALMMRESIKHGIEGKKRLCDNPAKAVEDPMRMNFASHVNPT